MTRNALPPLHVLPSHTSDLPDVCLQYLQVIAYAPIIFESSVQRPVVFPYLSIWSLNDVSSVVDDSIAANQYPHILSVCEVEDGLAQLGSAHS